MSAQPLCASCLNDRPLTLRDGDHLNNYRFAKGLIDFISQAATPITIAIQGGWGSGKTSLINLLGQGLRDKTGSGNKSLCVFVNAWEHSLFQAEAGRAAIAAGLLEGLIEEIASAVEDSPDIPPTVKSEALGQDSPLDKAKKVAVTLGKFMLRTAVKQAVNIDLHHNLSAGAERAPDGAKAVRALKEALRKAIGIIREETPYRRFVCFIDDLDRVHPASALEILDALKNVFDIEDCVFVLAIDYEVVVKGLEEKFGSKTEANEREFRQYFDKIIQIPFTMPVGAYSEYLKDFIVKSLEPLGYDPKRIPPDFLENIKTAAYWATGGVPRSVKRIINTLSLMQNIQRAAGAEEADEILAGDETSSPLADLETQFIVVALHINFPEISRGLMEKPDFTAWRFEDRQKAWSLGEEHYEALKNDPTAGADWAEDWLRVAYCLCRKYSWYRGREKAVAGLLLSLRTALRRGPGREPASAGPLSADDSDRLSDILDMMRVVSVDSGPDRPGEGAGLTGQGQLRFWEAVSAGLLERKNMRTRTPQARAYLDVSLGRTGFFLSNVIWARRKEISVRFLMVSKEADQNRKMYGRLLADKEALEKALGASLEWGGDDKGPLSVGLSRHFDLISEHQFQEGVDWMVEWIAKFKEVFSRILKIS